MAVRGPHANEEAEMIKAFIVELESPVFFDDNGIAHPLICCVCDSIARVDIAMEWISVASLIKHCSDTKVTKALLTDVYPAALIAQYTVPNVPSLQAFVLSPASVHDPTQDTIAICELCANHFKSQGDVDRYRRFPPDQAIISAYLIGDAPAVLTDLNEVEIALLSTVRTSCQSWIYFAGCHQHIQGWHTFYENRPAANVANINNLADAGLKGQLLVVLCGPFTKTQVALARAQTLVNADKVIAAYEWLKSNNYQYCEVTIPRPEDLPIPQIINDDM
jgi:hypothetical protein